MHASRNPGAKTRLSPNIESFELRSCRLGGGGPTASASNVELNWPWFEGVLRRPPKARKATSLLLATQFIVLLPRLHRFAWDVVEIAEVRPASRWQQ